LDVAGPVLETGGTSNLNTIAYDYLDCPSSVFDSCDAFELQYLDGSATMTTRRAALYAVGGTLLLAYLAAADSGMPQLEPSVRDSARHTPQEFAPPDPIAENVRAQAATLRERLAAAPVPDIHGRNPFGFAPAPDAHPGAALRSARAAVADGAPLPPPDPQLILMGVAEDTPDGKVTRTAIIGGAADALYVVIEGENVAGRYRVTAVGPDIVELRDLLTGGYRRLAMR
jgi:hypothetical protein